MLLHYIRSILLQYLTSDRTIRIEYHIILRVPEQCWLWKARAERHGLMLEIAVLCESARKESRR